MKQYFLLTSLLFGFSQLASAQFFAGLRAGIYTGGYYPIKTDKFTFPKGGSGVGWALGVPFNLKLNNVMSLQPEINYLLKGGTSEGKRNTMYGNYYQDKRYTWFQYVDVPLLMRFAIGGKKFRVFSLIGPFISYLSTGVDSYTYTYTTFGLNSSTTDLEIYSRQPNSQKRYNRIDTGYQLGGGMSFKMGTGYLTFDARLMQGFLKVNIPNQSGYNIYNVGVLFSTAYMFKVISKKES